ncbi:exosome complex component rrp43 [Anaeramoeba flamelloides]|uniref:Ribosomal RNA-processing protein 43 n=1 Tax=Anaeramoeba flamelloides TaxID=1746091 RepID=A0ABQ8X5F1_9EUKA|nr:exosome complex component rrp43 [Anaeramoeba flamelloides]
MAQVFAKIHPKEFFQKFFEKGVRPDNRKLNTFRKPKILKGHINSAIGSSTVRLGNTSVVSGIQAEVVVPDLNKPKMGKIQVNVELTDLSSSKHSTERVNERSAAISEYIESTLINTGTINLEELCIQESEKVWMIYLDIYTLNCDGNVLDACIISALAALQNTTLDPVIIVGENEESKEIQKEIILHNLPIPSSFGFFEDYILADPTADEEEIINSKLTIILGKNNKKSICDIYKTGSYPISRKTISTCIELAKNRSKYVIKQLKN